MKDQIEEEFNSAVEIREELNSVHWKEYELLATVFSTLFSVEKRALKFISDLNYYRGGYPSDSSPPRINALFERIGVAASFYHELGRLDELNMILGAYGFEIHPAGDTDMHVSMSRTRIEDSKKAKAALEKLQDDYNFDIKLEGRDPQDVIQDFLDKTYSLQHTICTMADEIKIDLYEKANAKVPSLGKSGFVTAVNSVANKRIKEARKKDTGTLVDRALEKSETLRTDADLIEESIVASEKERLIT